MPSKNLASTIFHGVPRAFGELFRATKAPSVILLTWFIGFTVALSTWITISMTVYRSMLPIDLLIVGGAQAIERDPSASDKINPRARDLLETMTPAKKRIGKWIFNGFIIMNFVIVVVLF